MKKRTVLTNDSLWNQAKNEKLNIALALFLLTFMLLSMFYLLSVTESKDSSQPHVYAHLRACDDLSLSNEEPEDLEEWQKERYLSPKFQYELETPTAKCTGEVGVKIHNQVQENLFKRQNP